MKNVYLTGFSVLIGLMLLSGCDQQNVMSFDKESFSAVHFSTDSLSYSFLGNSEDSHLMEVPVQIMGDSAAGARSFEVEVVRDSLTTAEPEDYEIREGVVEAGAFDGVLPIVIYNSPKLSDQEVSLHLKVTESASFREGTVEAGHVVVYWTDKVIVPAWSYFQYFFCSYPSTAAYRAIVESTGITEFGLSEYRDVGPTGAEAMGRQFGDYVKAYNEQHPDDPLIHDDGPQAGEEIQPIYYSQN